MALKVTGRKTAPSATSRLKAINPELRPLHAFHQALPSLARALRKQYDALSETHLLPHGARVVLRHGLSPKGTPLLLATHGEASAFIDPSRNVYYLAVGAAGQPVEPHAARVDAIGPFRLPPAAQLAKRRYSEGELNALDGYVATL